MTKTLHITVEPAENVHEETLESIQAMERGEAPERQHVLNFESEAEMSRLMGEKNLELLRAIRRHEPTSMREAARLVERDIKEVSKNLHELEALNVVEFVQEGRAKRPVVEFDEFKITVPLAA